MSSCRATNAKGLDFNFGSIIKGVEDGTIVHIPAPPQCEAARRARRAELAEAISAARVKIENAEKELEALK